MANCQHCEEVSKGLALLGLHLVHLSVDSLDRIRKHAHRVTLSVAVYHPRRYRALLEYHLVLG
jgi:hypothetical protein